MMVASRRCGACACNTVQRVIEGGELVTLLGSAELPDLPAEWRYQGVCICAVCGAWRISAFCIFDPTPQDRERWDVRLE